MTKHFVEEIADFGGRRLTLTPTKLENFKAILLRHAQVDSYKCRPNHGALASVRLLKRAVSLELDHNVWEDEVLPASLAIALHDKGLWPELIEKEIFPLNIETVPISVLLIIADQYQNWGRPGLKADPEGKKTLLSNINNSDEVVEIETLFLDKPAAILSKVELDEIKRVCISCAGINFKAKSVL
jgi:hypothetical protein